MAEIGVERKRPSIWPWIIGLAALAILVWLMLEMFDGEDEMAAPVLTDTAGVVRELPAPAVSEPATEPAATPLEIGSILAEPARFGGQGLAGQARVAEVPTDRGFWIEAQGARVFVVLNDAPGETPVDIDPDQTLRLRDARVLTPAELRSLPGSLDADTRGIAAGQAAILAVDEANVEILGAAGGV